MSFEKTGAFNQRFCNSFSYTPYGSQDAVFSISCHTLFYSSCGLVFCNMGKYPNKGETCPGQNIDCRFYTFFAFSHFCPVIKKGHSNCPATAETVTTQSRTRGNRAPQIAYAV